MTRFEPKMNLVLCVNVNFPPPPSKIGGFLGVWPEILYPFSKHLYW